MKELVETLWADVRQGFRLLRKSPGFTVVAILSLALGVGANTTIFTLVNAVFLRSLPFAEPERLVSVYTTDEKAAFAGLLNVSYPNYRDFRDHNDVFSGMLVWGPAALNLGVAAGGQGEPQQLLGQIVSGNYFAVLGVKPALGRTFLPEEFDGPPGSHPVVVLSHGLWSRRFGADPNLIGKAITLNNYKFTVAGVVPAAFHGTNTLASPDFWVPLSMYPQVLTGNYRQFVESRRSRLFGVVGRLKPGVNVEQAEAAMKAMARGLAERYPVENENRSVVLVPLTLATIHPNQRQNFVVAGTVLMTVVGLVLLIACANIANLLLARANTRRKEIAIRSSMGAGRVRVARQLLTESLLLSLLGAAAGLVLALWARNLLWAFRPPFVLADALDLSVNARVLGFTIAVAFLTGLVFGLAPALHASRPQFASLRSSTCPRLRSSVARALVVSEVAFSLVALVGAGLFLHSLRRAQHIDPGFETERLLVMSVNLGAQGYDAARGQQYYRRILESTRRIPGVRAAALAAHLPLAGGLLRTVFPEGAEASAGGFTVLTNLVSPGYFETTGIPVLEGRGLTEVDRESAPAAAVVNEAMASRFWPGENPVGRRFRFYGSNVMFHVVGQARNAKYASLGENPLPVIYLSMMQNYTDTATIHVRTAGPPAALLGAVRSEAQALDRNLPILNASTISDLLGRSLWAPRMGAVLLGIFGMLALALAGIGVYGVMAFSVSQRRQEMGIRLALGAQQQDLLKMVMREGAVLILAGLTVGLAGSLFLGRIASRLLFGVSPADPVALTGGCAVLLAVALVANYIPARRAARVDPLVALKYE